MNLSFASFSLFIAGALTPFASPASAPAAANSAAADTPVTAESLKKFEQAVDRTENLQLPINKAVLYRQAAVALIPTDKPRAVMLLKRALTDIDAAEASLKAQKKLDDVTFKQLEFHRLPVLMLMERIDPMEALSLLAPPQTADLDTAFQAMFFSRLKNPELVRQTAMHKLDYGPSPTVVAAYDVLQKQNPGVARSLATAIILKLTKSDPEKDPVAVQTAFALLRLLRTDIGSLAPVMVIDQSLVSSDSVRDLFSFIGDAFLASKDPEMLILGERPSLYVQALEEYAPDKAQDVKLLPFAAPDAKSLIFSPEKPVYDANHPDPATLKPEEIEQRAAMRARIEAQIKDTNSQIAALSAKIKLPSLTEKERDAAVFAVVDQANRAISLARSGATTFDREAFRDGELELYTTGSVTGVVDSASAVLQEYAMAHPKVAEDAARNFDGHEVQTEVALQIAIREMTGSAPYLVPPVKAPANPVPAAVAPGAPTQGQPGLHPTVPSAVERKLHP